MAKNKAKEEGIIMDSMPGGDIKTAEEVEPFQVDLNFEDAPVAEEVEVVAEEAEEAEEVVAEEEVAEEIEAETIEEAVAETDDTVEFPTEEATEVVEEEVIAEEPKKPKAPMVPKSRLDEVLAKNKKMQKRIEDIEKQEAEVQAQAPQFDFDVKEQEYQNLILDGESAKAVSLRNEIRKAEKEALMFDIQQQMGQTVQQDRAQQELAQKAEEIASTFPMLDQNSTEFNEELTTEVMELRDAFITQGYEPADSLAKATEYTLAAKKPELLQTTEAKTTTQTRQLAQKKQKASVQNKIAASKAQPPTLKGEGTAKRGDKATDINILSDDEFGALPAETIRRLRGDFA